MITYNSKRFVTQNKVFIDGVCLSTDQKPTTEEIANGSVLCEMDTSTVYFYDEANHTWRAF